MKAYNLVLGRFFEASVCVALLTNCECMSVTSLHRESTDSLIISDLRILCYFIESVLEINGLVRFRINPLC